MQICLLEHRSISWDLIYYQTSLRMGTRLRSSDINKDKQKATNATVRSSNVNDEYLSAVRTKSYADLSQSRLSETLLEPCQETIASILESSPVFSHDSTDNLKSLLSNFFHVSAEASKFCTQLLRNLSQFESDRTPIRRILDAIDGHDSSPSDQFDLDLHSCVVLANPFPDSNKPDFDQFHDQHSAMLNHLKSKKKRIVRKIRLIKCFNRASATCLAGAGGIAAAVAVFLAVHAFAALAMCPALLGGVPIRRLRRRRIVWPTTRTKSGFLRRAVVQLDVAAKGAYVMNRDFDTMRRLVARLEEEIEAGKAAMTVWVERFPREVVKVELRRYELGLKKKVEEVEEHVCLCLVTINRARALVVKEIHV